MNYSQESEKNNDSGDDGGKEPDKNGGWSGLIRKTGYLSSYQYFVGWFQWTQNIFLQRKMLPDFQR